MAEAFTFGMEEEYFLVDAETKLVARDVPPAFFSDAKRRAMAESRPSFCSRRSR